MLNFALFQNSFRTGEEQVMKMGQGNGQASSNNYGCCQAAKKVMTQDHEQTRTGRIQADASDPTLGITAKK